MHCRIFQVSKEQNADSIFQVSKEQNADSISESRYEDYFIPSIADYVVKVADVEDDYKWLSEHAKGIKIETKDGVTTLTIVSKEEYFEKSFNEFQELIKKFNEYTLKEFIDAKNWLDFYNFKRCYDNRYGFYVDDNDEYFGTVTFDEFMRNVNNGDVYYLSSTFDYHF